MILDIWSIAIIVIVFQGLFLLSFILSSKERRQKQGNIYLMLIILILIWFLFEFFTIRNKIEVGLNVFYGTRYGSWFLLGPITYFYFKAITVSNWRFSRKELWHFIPFILFVIVIPMISYKALNNRQVDYGMLSVFDNREKALSTIQWTYSIIFVLQFVHLGYFLFKNLSLVNKYKKGLASEYSSLDIRIDWLRNFNVILLIVLVFSSIFLCILLITDIYRRHLDYIYVIPIGVLFYVVSFKFMRTEWKPVENGTKYHGSSFKKDNIQDHIAKLDHLMRSEKVYLDNVIRLSDLATMMNMSRHHLSQLLNEHYKLTFYDFINKFRIDEAKRIIELHPEYKLLQVAFDSGFNNKTSFVNAFKKFERSTPSKFRDSIQL